MGSLSLYTVLNELESQNLVLGLILVCAGVVFIRLGFQVFNGLVILSFGIAGFLIGRNLPIADKDMQLICSLVGAVGLAAASTFAMKLSVAVLAGGGSALGVMIIAASLGLKDMVVLIAGIVALGVVVSLALIKYREITVYILSLEGSLLFMAGLIVLVSHSPTTWAHFRSILMEHPFFGLFLVLSGTVTGFYFQIADLRQKDSGLSV